MSRLPRARRRTDRGLAAIAPLLAALAGPVGAAPAAAPATPAQRVAAERLVHVLQYVAVDYGAAVADGAIASPFEYAEMRRFGQLLVDRSDELAEIGASEDTRDGLLELRREIRELRPWDEVRARADRLATSLVRELGLAAQPAAAPDPGRGRELYARRCATCHGDAGRGDGPAAEGIEPPPTSFADPRMDLLSLHHLYGTIRFGIDGTAMPAYADELDPQAIWDVASHVERLAAGLGSDRAAPRARPDAPEAREAAPAPGSGIDVALRLQTAFSGVAERVAPSVVGVTGLVRRPGSVAPPAARGGWRADAPEEQLYPGFERARSGSGFVVGDAEHVLTARELLLDDAGDPVDAVDVELDDGRHRLARIVGLEPTVGLGVLELEPVAGASALRPLRPADAGGLRVGHWAIALGNPEGPGRSFAVGTLASLPERQCYQQELGSTLLRASLRVPAGAVGGPLVDIEGDAIGMVVSGPGDSGAARPFEFALPIELALAIYEPLVASGSRRSPWLGFSVLERRLPRRRAGARGEVRLPAMGVFIDGVFEPSPAAAADVRIGDWLLAIDGDRLTSVSGFQRRLYLSGIGRSVELRILRGSEILEKRVEVEERPEAARAR